MHCIFLKLFLDKTQFNSDYLSDATATKSDSGEMSLLDTPKLRLKKLGEDFFPIISK